MPKSVYLTILALERSALKMRRIFFALVLFVSHTGSALLSLRFMSGNDIVATFWAPTGIALGSLLLGGYRYLPVVFLSAFTANIVAGCPWWVALTFSAANGFQAALGYTLLARLRPIDLGLNRARDYFRIFLYTGIFAPLPSALIGATTLAFAGITRESWLQNFQFWWMGDSLGVIVLTPLMLIWRRLESFPVRPALIYEGIIGLVLAFVAGQAIFSAWFAPILGDAPRAFIMTLFVVWAAVRFGRHATLVVLMMIIIQVLQGSVSGTGYFHSSDRRVELVNVWLYIAILSATGMALATFIHERKSNIAALGHTTQNLEQLSQMAHIGAWELDAATMSIWFSREALRIVDLPPEHQLTISEAIDFIEPAEREAHSARVKLAIEHQVAWDVEFGMTTATGRSIWVRSQGKPIIEKGKVIQLAGTVHDLTERKKRIC